MEFEVLGPSDFKPKGGRRKRGGAEPDQATVVETPVVRMIDVDEDSSDVKEEVTKNTTLREIVKVAIKKSVDVIHQALQSEAAKNTAILGITVIAATTALAAADKFYAGDVCSIGVQQMADTVAAYGLTGPKIKCDAAQKAYIETMNLLKPAILGGLGAASSRLMGIKITIGEGFIANIMNKVITSLQATPDASPAEGAPATAPKQPKKGGRTKRRVSKKGRKGGKSRKHRR